MMRECQKLLFAALLVTVACGALAFRPSNTPGGDLQPSTVPVAGNYPLNPTFTTVTSGTDTAANGNFTSLYALAANVTTLQCSVAQSANGNFTVLTSPAPTWTGTEYGTSAYYTGVVNAVALNANTSVGAASVQAQTGNFTTLVAANANLSNLSAASPTFTGTVSGANANYTGTFTAASVVANGNVTAANVVTAATFATTSLGTAGAPALSLNSNAGVFSKNAGNIALAANSTNFPTMLSLSSNLDPNGPSIIIGQSSADNANGTGNADTIMGLNASTANASINSALVLGHGALVTQGQGVVSAGFNATAGSAFGYDLQLGTGTASGGGSISLSSTVAGQYSSGLGFQSVVAGAQSVGVGYQASVPGTYTNSGAFGARSVVTASHQLMMGTSSETVVHPGPSTLSGAVTMGSTLVVNGNTIVFGNANQAILTGGSGGTGFQLSMHGGHVQVLSDTGVGKVFEAYDFQAVGPSSTFSAASGATGIQFGNYAGTYGVGYADSTHLNLYTNSVSAMAFDASQNAVHAGNVTIPSANYYGFVNGSQILSSANGTFQLVDSAGSVNDALILGPATNTGAAVMLKSIGGTTLKLFSGDGSAQASLSVNVIAGQSARTAAGNASAPAFAQNTTGVLGGVYFPSQQTVALATNGLPAVTLDVNQNAILGGNVTLPHATLDTNGVMVPAQINNESYYWSDDFASALCSAIYLNSGNFSCNPTSTPGALTPSTIGVLQTYTSSATQGGGVSGGTSIITVKSTAITYQWRIMFYLPTASTSTNRYIAYIGSVNSNTSNSSYTPYSGFYLKYSDNVNSGNWVLGSAVNGTQTTTSTSTAATNGWHKLSATLVNGTYTYVLDGVTLGTVTDTNIPTTVSSGGAWTGLFGAVMVPDGTNWTAQQYLTVDRADFYMTGLSR
jgi:hypothetical protein